MKIECTKRQLDAAASLYREREEECRKLDAEAEELLTEGEYVRRERVLKEAGVFPIQRIFSKVKI